MKISQYEWSFQNGTPAFWVTGWLILFAFSSAWAGTTVLQSNEKRVVFRYNPRIKERQQMSNPETPEYFWEIENASSIPLKKGYLLPCKSFWVGVPPKTRPAVHILAAQFHDKKQILLEKVQLPPREKSDFALSRERVPAQFTAATSSGFYPSVVARVAEFGWLRNQKIARIEVFPIRVDFSRQQARLYSSVEIAVDFLPEKHPTGPTGPAGAAFTAVARSLLLNDNQAENWTPKSSFVQKRAAERDSFRLWFKMPIAKTGMVKIDQLSLRKIGLAVGTIRADELHIFYGGGSELPWDVKAPKPRLREVATYFADANGDGVFGKEDALIFYAESLNRWQFSALDKRFHHIIHHYARQNVYWLAVGGGFRKPMASMAQSLANAETTRTAPRYFYREVEKLNPEKSGIQWYWAQFSGNTTRRFTLPLENAVAQDSFFYRLRFLGASFHHHSLKVSLNGTPLATIDLPYERELVVAGTRAGGLNTGQNTLTIRQISTEGRADKSLLDWVELNYEATLTADSAGLVFYSPQKTEPITYVLSGFQEGQVTVFDVSDPFAVRFAEAKRNPSDPKEWFFTDLVSSGRQKKYVAVTPEQIASVSQIQRVPSPLAGLRNAENRADYLIITAKDLLGPDLSRLAAHRSDSRAWAQHSEAPAVKIVTMEQIYDAFSWGVPDPTAIRNFLKYTLVHWATPPSYVLLVGNACYDMKRNSSASPPTLVPTHEDGQRVTDDWFAFLDGDRIMDVLIGRLSVQNRQELHNVVQKILDYDALSAPGPWQGRVLFIADDANSPTFKKEDSAFGRDTETLSQDSVFSDLAVEKVYLDAYLPDPSGTKERAKRDFLADLNHGVAFVNFLGHANLEVLTHESIFYTPQDLDRVQNGRHYPLFFAGTCAVGQFDYDRKPCMAEYLTNLPERGMIATIASTRWTWHALNYGVNRAFVHDLFAPVHRQKLTLGEALLAAKLTSRYADHRELITLFGDPALRLALPLPRVRVQMDPDSISLHKRTHIEASVESGRLATSSEGEIFFQLRASGKIHRTVGYSYFLPGEVIYQDTLQLKNGKADARFFPNTVALRGGNLGQLFAFAWNRFQQVDARVDSIPMKRDFIHSLSEIDSTGPQIRVFVNGNKITEGEEITGFPVLHCQFHFEDEKSGLLTDRPQEYPVELRAEGDSSNERWNLTAQIVRSDSTGKTAFVKFDCPNLSLGEHTFEIQAWDRAYNPTYFRWKAQIVSPRVELSDVLTYPNPAVDQTFFTFRLSAPAEVRVKIYTLSGRLVESFRADAGFGFNKIPEEGWSCRDRDGDLLANGVYLYKIEAQPEEADILLGAQPKRTSAVGRLVIVR